MTFEETILAHCLKLLAWDRAYAAEAIRWYLQTCPWLEPIIGQQLRAAWLSSASTAPAVLSPGQRE